MTGRAMGSLALAAVVMLPACAKREAAPGRAAAMVALAPQQAPAPAADTGRMLVRRATMRVSVAEVAAASAEAERITREGGGYVEQSQTSEERRVVLALRVPADGLDTVLARLAALGHVEERTVSSEDVTEQAIDLDARLANLRAVRDRLKQHLGHTANLKDVIALEEQLTRTQSDIDSLEGRLKHLRSMVALASVQLTLERRRVLGPLGYVAKGVWWGLSKLFVIRD